ncbi:hypothetical protein SAMN05216368_1169 [Cryobacterium flavum]|uniref:Uncharacterized protein n=2 Tax=Cryobacterium flavum TaxID=1424659 RepID=A0A4R8V8Y2_9MICO|nr:hypothetical protein [Cryobacterium flavum]TFB78295.1 hypothetical protein E3O21_06440 [Cryobacterium flavum]TFB78533.1 hypothetical protein E3O21_05315 [Cryobacterium flavum]SDO36012.1 hypothetical protein SAMN05216368_1169 [Cryobacterium flavum]
MPDSLAPLAPLAPAKAQTLIDHPETEDYLLDNPEQAEILARILEHANESAKFDFLGMTRFVAKLDFKYKNIPIHFDKYSEANDPTGELAQKFVDMFNRTPSGVYRRLSPAPAASAAKFKAARAKATADQEAHDARHAAVMEEAAIWRDNNPPQLWKPSKARRLWWKITRPVTFLLSNHYTYIVGFALLALAVVGGIIAGIWWLLKMVLESAPVQNTTSVLGSIFGWIGDNFAMFIFLSLIAWGIGAIIYKLAPFYSTLVFILCFLLPPVGIPLFIIWLIFRDKD